MNSLKLTNSLTRKKEIFKPINSNRYINITNEDIYHFTKDDKTKVNRKSVGVPYKWKCNLKNRKTGEIKEDKR